MIDAGTFINGDMVIQLAIVLIGLPCAIIATRITRTISNPTTIVFLAFFVPLFFATFRLSGLQTTQWHYDTYITLVSTICAWLAASLIVLIKSKPKECGLNEHKLDNRKFSIAVRAFAIIVLASYFLANLIQAKTFLPILHPEIAFDVHAEFPAGIRFFARATPAVAILTYILFYKNRRPIDLALLILAILTPLTRLSRIDPVLSIAGIACIYSTAPIFKITPIRAAILISICSALLIGSAELGTQRQNRFGEYDFKYADMIKWKSEIKGPSELAPVLYGYTSLSFENLDASISNYKGNHTLVLYSFDWLFSGFLKLNWIIPYDQARAEYSQREIIATAATVPTALLPFYSDFGAFGIFLPLVLYMGIWIYFFNRRRSSFLFLSLFGIYAGAFALSSFQSLITSGPIAQQLVWASLIFWYSRTSTKNATQE